MVGSIDPRCETIRGTHWPKEGRVVVWSSRRGNHLGQRSIATASTGRTYGCKRSDQTRKTLAARGPSTYGSRRSPGRRCGVRARRRRDGPSTAAKAGDGARDDLHGDADHPSRHYHGGPGDLLQGTVHTHATG